MKEPTISPERKVEIAGSLHAFADELRAGGWISIPDDLYHLAERVHDFEEWQYTKARAESGRTEG